MASAIDSYDKIRVYNVRIGWLVTEGEYMYTTAAGKVAIRTRTGLFDYDKLHYCFLGPESLRHMDRHGNQAE
jgi:hypothetical protein